jgi:16S rRNA C967 or C1407 C5-methylase (RsmB/RsmF family)
MILNLNGPMSSRSHIDRLGILSVLVCCYHGQAFPLRRKFDDSPGSSLLGRGIVRARLPPTLSENQGGPASCPVQKELLRQALAVLRAGGTLVYSTCTYAPEENEAVVNEALKDGEAELLPISLPISHSKGLHAWMDEIYHPDMVKAVRFYPHQVNSWGFFIARLRKRS